MRLATNYLGVRVIRRFDNGAVLGTDGQPVRGLNGLILLRPDERLHADESLINKPGACATGEIVQLFDELSPYPEVFEIDGEIYGCNLFPGHELKVGDVVCFAEGSAEFEFLDADTGVLPVPYWALLCIIRGKQDLVPVGGYTLAEPIMPPGTVKEFVEGNIISCRKDPLGHIIETNVQPLEGQGLLAFVGRPLLGQSMPYYPGQRVIYNRWTNGPKFRIEGKEYFAVRHPDIIGVVKPGAEVFSMGEARFSRTIKRPIRKE